MSKSLMREDLRECFEINMDCIFSSNESTEENIGSRNINERKRMRLKSGRCFENLDELDKLARSDLRSGHSGYLKIKDKSPEEDRHEDMNQDCFRSSQVEKDLLLQFTQNVGQIYADKFGALLRKHDLEIKNCKKKFLDGLNEELENWQRHINLLMDQEEKLLYIMEELRKNYISLNLQNKTMKRIALMHKNFIKNFEQLIRNQKSEEITLESTIMKEVENLKAALLNNSEIVNPRITKCDGKLSDNI